MKITVTRAKLIDAIKEKIVQEKRKNQEVDAAHIAKMNEYLAKLPNSVRTIADIKKFPQYPYLAYTNGFTIESLEKAIKKLELTDEETLVLQDKDYYFAYI